jgi:hypothetical protein
LFRKKCRRRLVQHCFEQGSRVNDRIPALVSRDSVTRQTD